MGSRLFQPRGRTILGFGLATAGVLALVIGAYAWLLVDANDAQLTTTQWMEVAAPIGGAILLFWLAFRWMQRRTMAMAALREAVLASENRKQTTDALRLADRFGKEAAVWNALLDRLGPGSQAEGPNSAGAGAGTGSEERLALAVCSALWQGVVVVGQGMEVEYANPAAAMLLGTDLSSLTGKAITEAIDISPLHQASGGLRRGTIEIERKTSTTPTRLRVSVRSGREAEGYVLVIEDVTQQVAAEEARANFIAHATHELRTPLTNMRLYAETALSDECDEAMLGTCLNVINQEVRRLERVVSDMLSVSEMEAGALSISEGEARLDQLFEELQLEFESQAKAKDIKLRFTLPPKLPVVKGDRDKLLQAFHNVLGNAIKYTPEGGEVTFGADWGDDGLAITVRDTGVGIGDDDRQRIFDRFYRTDDVRASGTQGTGLGLTLAKEILLCHEGAIDVDSTPGKGSLFTMSLPSTRLVA